MEGGGTCTMAAVPSSSCCRSCSAVTSSPWESPASPCLAGEENSCTDLHVNWYFTLETFKAEFSSSFLRLFFLHGGYHT